MIAPSPFGACGSGLEADDVLAGQAELGRVFDGHDALVARQARREAVQQRGLAAARAAGDEHVATRRDRLTQEIGDVGRAEVFELEGACAEAADREARTVDRHRRHHRVHS